MKFAALTFTMFASVAAMAQNTSRLDYTQPNSAKNPQGFWLFGSAVGGALDNIQNEDSINIDQAGLKIIGSQYTENWINDLSLGAFRFDNRDADQKIDTAILEGVAGYRLAQTWHAGPVINTTLGKARELGASDDTLAAFAGVGVYKDWALGDSTLMRLGLKGMADLNIPAQTVTNAALELQIGGSPGATRVRSEQASRPVPAANEAAPTGVSEMVVPKRIYFEVDKAEISSGARQDLEKLSSALKDNPDVASGIEVQGFADPTGTESYNEELSQRRAESVKRALASDGVSDSTIGTQALGESQPVIRGGQVDYDRSRRVKIILKDVKDSQKAKEILSTVE
ncbi:MAG: OmpA family protein [Bdellovibrionaceae bacterium]|nr:OmpA family protein [Pseudobdellovibrionaceae bacterium]